jgi:hypothetical protein
MCETSTSQPHPFVLYAPHHHPSLPSHSESAANFHSVQGQRQVTVLLLILLHMRSQSGMFKPPRPKGTETASTPQQRLKIIKCDLIKE